MLPYDDYSWIKVKRFAPTEDMTLEEKYKLLEDHHEKETRFLIAKVRELGKAEAVLQKIVESVNQGNEVHIQSDFGGNTLTMTVGDMHTHLGELNGTLTLLIDNLYNSLNSTGPHLSWSKEDV